MKNLICIVCPKGCHLSVDDENDFQVTGNSCPRGAEYGKKELVAPTRVITSTVAVCGGVVRRCPVKTSAPIPKELIFEVMVQINSAEAAAPVALGQIILKNVCSTGIDIIATKACK